MTAKEARALGYKLIKASPFEVGLIKNDKGIRTWWASEFGGKMPPLDHYEIIRAIEAQEELERDSDVTKDLHGQRLPSNKCPGCGAILDAATCTEPATDDGRERPGPGDCCVCSTCALILTYTDLMVLREMTTEKFDALPDDTKQILLDAVRFIRENNPR